MNHPNPKVGYKDRKEMKCRWLFLYSDNNLRQYYACGVIIPIMGVHICYKVETDIVFIVLYCRIPVLAMFPLFDGRCVRVLSYIDY